MKRILFCGLVVLLFLSAVAGTPRVSASDLSIVPPAANEYWSAQYFNNTTLAGTPALTRGDAELNFSWDPGTSPAGGVAANNFSVRWTRAVYFDRSGAWTFTTTSDDGIRVWVDNRITIDAWYDHSATVHSGQIDLAAGTHTVRVEYYNRVMGGTARLTYAPTSSFPNWKGEYYANAYLSGAPALMRDDGAVNFDWGTGSPDAIIPTDHFSARWTRTQYFAGGTWRFTVTADDGVRLWVDNTLLIDRWYDHPAVSFSADIGVAAGNHALRLEYYDKSVNAVARLGYTLVNMTPPAAGVWRGQYFANASLAGNPVVIRDDPSLHFIWNSASPAPGVPADYFSVKWDSTQVLPHSGNYTILVSSDDGVRVWLDGVLVVDAWYDHSAALFSTVRWLAAGAHKVHVEYYDRSLSAMVGVDLIPTSGPAPVPSGGEVMIDNGSSGWQSGGSPSDWRVLPNGIGANSLWTYNNSYTAPYYNWVRWYPSLARAGNYEVYAYIPSGIATTDNARYWVRHAGRYDLVARSQGSNGGQWMSLGTYYFTGGSDEFVSLSDVTYECYLCRTVAFDAVKFVPR